MITDKLVLSINKYLLHKDLMKEQNLQKKQ